jgi:SAM-dependent methyltransferase
MTSSGNDVARGLLFGSVADRYERFRTGYPGELADLVLQYAGRPVRTVLEVGAGTGKATRVFAARGIEVTALEPDADMVRVLVASSAGLPVRAVVATFEQFATSARFDVLLAAASWHWTDPATRWARAVDLLVPGGVLALCGSPGEPHDPVLAAALHEVERETLAPAGQVPGQVPGHQWTDDDIRAAGLVDVERHELARRVRVTREDFGGRLGTVSAYLLLEPAARAEAIRRALAVLPEAFDVEASIRLFLSRRP